MSNPVNEYLQGKEAQKKNRKEHEIELLNTWRTSKKPEDLSPLLDLYKPVIAQKMTQYRAPNVPEASMRAELQKHLIKAFETYDPNRGAALNTHVHTRLQKAMRYNNRHQNIGYVPEGVSGHIGKLIKAEDTLRQDLGRQPTHEEIGGHMGLSAKLVGRIQAARSGDVPSSAFETDPTSRQHPLEFEEQQIAIAQNILPDIFPNQPHLHTLFNHVFGTNGYAHITSTNELAKKMNMTAPQVSKLKTQMGATLRQHMGLNLEDD